MAPIPITGFALSHPRREVPETTRVVTVTELTNTREFEKKNTGIVIETAEITAAVVATVITTLRHPNTPLEAAPASWTTAYGIALQFPRIITDELTENQVEISGMDTVGVALPLHRIVET